MRITFLVACAAILFLTACAPKKTEINEFNKRCLETARLILDKGATNLNTELKWSEVDDLFGADGFRLHPAGVGSPVEWAFFEVRIRGDESDKSRCILYLASTNSLIRKDAEMTLDRLGQAAQK